MRRDVVDLVKGLQIAAAASLAVELLSGDELRERREGEFRGTGGAHGAEIDGFFLGHSMDGRGTGTMKRPPRRRYSSCWVMISSLKFQGRIST